MEWSLSACPKTPSLMARRPSSNDMGCAGRSTDRPCEQRRRLRHGGGGHLRSGHAGENIAPPAEDALAAQLVWQRRQPEHLGSRLECRV